jgi:phytoene/squalene synthetase
MDLYDQAARESARRLTMRYSTSFSLASKLFDKRIRDDIYAIYGLVRIADEIVDTYRGADAPELLAAMQAETYAAIRRGYSADMIIHAFAATARRYGIGEELIRPFFESMAMDLEPGGYDRLRYEHYIYGSAEVVGLMCLRVFVGDDEQRYIELSPGARALGAAYQKVNFLRDLAADRAIGRNYFPELQSKPLGEPDKLAIIQDIEKDFATADAYIERLPRTAKRAVRTSYIYYSRLLDKLRTTPARVIWKQRIRVSNTTKVSLIVRQRLRR